MTKIFWFHLFIIILLIISCKRTDLPTLTTTTISNIEATSATSGGNVIFDGGAMVTSRGVCWSTENNPTTNNDKTTDGAGEGNYTSNLTNLLGGKLYYVRAYGINSAGTGYGETLTFTTLGQSPSSTTLPATNKSSIGATLNGLVNANYLATTVLFEYGVSTSYGSEVPALQSPIMGNSDMSVSVMLNNLTVGTIYHFRVKAANSLGTSYGNDVSFQAVYATGESYFGGIIFHIDNSGLHGLVAASTDQHTGATWGCRGTNIIGADNTSIGSGNQNTNDILNSCQNSGIAAEICSNLTLNGYDDWFLPSIEELEKMYINLYLKDIGGFTHGKYFWSSTEVNQYNAYARQFSKSVSGYSNESKNYLYFVRAVRSF